MKAEIPGGMSASKAERDGLAELFSGHEFEPSLEAAFLLKQTGIAVAAWTRNPVPQEVISVMAATMWGSLDTMIRTLGGEGPRSALVEVEGRRMLVTQVEPNWTLLLIAPRSVGKRRLRHEAQWIVERLARVRRPSIPRGAAVAIER